MDTLLFEVLENVIINVVIQSLFSAFITVAKGWN